ncbi:protein S100-A9-like [Peromyscus californicus insignis]|uniref:protein S100-A9-like n=1 Tax=Peromyscus californicus insignis TaxID=564181 RepID=UPI0022A73471|nr:protein S100-A9-like [Peromyscus californicus insignis]
MATKTPSVMERNINTIIDVFHQHSRLGGNTDTLSQKEFKKMVENDLANFLKEEKKDVKFIKDIMEDLDTNQDKELNFEEFVMLVAKLVFATHEKMHEGHPRGKDHSHGLGFGK